MKKLSKENIKLIEINECNTKLIHKFLLGCNKSLKTFRYFKNRNIEEAIKLHEYTIVMMYNDSVVGYGHLDRDCYHTWLGICLADSWTGFGLSKIIMDALTQKFPKRRLCLSVDTENQIAINLYEKYGFKAINNITKDVILMERK